MLVGCARRLAWHDAVCVIDVRAVAAAHGPQVRIALPDQPGEQAGQRGYALMPVLQVPTVPVVETLRPTGDG